SYVFFLCFSHHMSCLSYFALLFLSFFFVLFFFFFFNDPATTEIYTLSLHDALPICGGSRRRDASAAAPRSRAAPSGCRCSPATRDRKSTRLNSSHQIISYAVFCLKKKKKQKKKNKQRNYKIQETKKSNTK